MVKKRRLSEFLGRELLYDYASGKIDESAAESMKQCLREHPNLVEELKSLVSAIEYCKQASGIRIQKDHVASLVHQPGLKERAQKYLGNFPAPLNWGVQGLILTLGASLVIGTLPFFRKSKENTSTVILSETKIKEKSADQPPLESVPNKVAENLPITPEPIQGATDLRNSAKPSTEDTNTTSNTTPQAKGFVHRIYLFSDDVETLTPDVTQKIVSLGGAKAGEVELGWKRRSGSYFHFAMPEIQYEELLSYLNTISKVRVQKTAHRRVMPQGQVRIIMWLEHSGQPKRQDGDDGENSE